MLEPSRRFVMVGGCASVALGLAGCNTTSPPSNQLKVSVVDKPAPIQVASLEGLPPAARYQALYATIPDEKFPVNGIKPGTIPPAFWRTDIDYHSNEAPGTIIVDPHAHYLYHITSPGRATRYGVGVGRDGFAWSGTANINSKQEWPDWYPPKEMIERQAGLREELSKLQSGLGVAGGPHNPLGARAMYLWQDKKDTLFRIHGTLEPGSIGKSVSSGCIRMVNQDAIDLYKTVDVGTKVVVI